MKLILILISTLTLTSSTTTCNTEEDNLAKSVAKVIKAFNEKDATTLNQMIHKDYELAVIFRSGVFNQYEITNKIDFNKPVPKYITYPNNLNEKLAITYETLPTYSCDTYKWNKQGLYCDKNTRNNLLSRTAENIVKYDLGNVPAETIEKYREIESKSVRIVLVDENDGELIFYLTLVDKKWYISILDFVSSDCSS